MTSMNANNQDFNWIDACLRCSIEHEFESLKKCLMTSVDTMQSYVEQKGHLVEYVFDEDNGNACVTLNHTGTGQPSPTMKVAFRRKKDHILVEEWRSFYPDPDKTNPSMRIVPKLNDIGRCRYTIDGNTETEYLRWQVVRQALEPLFFPE